MKNQMRDIKETDVETWFLRRCIEGSGNLPAVQTQCMAFAFRTQRLYIEPSNSGRNFSDSIRSGKKNSGSSDIMILLMGEIIPIQLQYIIPKTIIM